MESPDSSDPHPRTDPIDEAFRSLASERRRAVLSFFHRSPEEVASVDDLVDHVAARSDEEREHVAIGLHHVTLPKLGESGLVEYDSRSRTVRYRGDPMVETLLEAAIAIEDADAA